MPALTPQFLYSIESGMQERQENEYQRLVESGNLYWDKFTRLIPIESGHEVITWVVNTAILEGTGLDPSVNYQSMTVMETEGFPGYLSAGLELQRAQFEDLRHPDGNGIDLSAEFAAQIGYQAAYYPQKSTTSLLLTGETGICYDKLTYFNNAHPSNPKDSDVGTFANIMTGTAGAGGAPATDANQALYPGKIDIRIGTGSVTVDSAFAGLQALFAYLMAQKMPNGVDPRFLRPKATLLPSTLYPFMTNLLDAKFIAMSSKGGGGGTTDIAGHLQKLGYGEPICAPELDSDPTSFYVICDQMASSQLGGIAYLDREAVGIRYFTGEGGGSMYDSILSENDTIKWIARGRSVSIFGHPYYLVKCKAT